MSSTLPTSQVDFSRLPPLTHNSTSPVEDSLWYCQDFTLGAGCVIIQPSSGKIVLLYDTHAKIWFLPKGRKDVGESLEQAALREAYEESGYRAEFLPLAIPTRAPREPQNASQGSTMLNTEPIYVEVYYQVGGRRTRPKAYEYLTFWYLACIGPEAVPEENTRKSDELTYQTYLLSYEEVVERLRPTAQGVVVQKGYELWQRSVAQPVNSPDNQG